MHSIPHEQYLGIYYECIIHIGPFGDVTAALIRSCPFDATPLEICNLVYYKQTKYELLSFYLE